MRTSWSELRCPSCQNRKTLLKKTDKCEDGWTPPATLLDELFETEPRRTNATESSGRT